MLLVCRLDRLAARLPVPLKVAIDGAGAEVGDITVTFAAAVMTRDWANSCAHCVCLTTLGCGPGPSQRQLIFAACILLGTSRVSGEGLIKARVLPSLALGMQQWFAGHKMCMPRSDYFVLRSAFCSALQWSPPFLRISHGSFV